MLEKIPDFSDQIFYLFFSNYQPPNAICKRALAYFLRIRISEIQNNGKKIIWEPKFNAKKFNFVDNLNFHNEDIFIYYDNDNTSFLLYTDMMLSNFPEIKESYEMLNKDTDEKCVYCLKILLPTDNFITLECEHKYCLDHIKLIIGQQTNNYYILSESKESKYQPKCLQKYCKARISQEFIKMKILTESEVSKYMKEMEKRQSIASITLSCCQKTCYDILSMASYITQLYDFDPSIFQGICKKKMRR